MKACFFLLIEVITCVSDMWYRALYRVVYRTIVWTFFQRNKFVLILVSFEIYNIILQILFATKKKHFTAR